MDQRLLQKMLVDAQKAQKDFQEKLKVHQDKVFEYVHGKDHVKVTANGHLQILKIVISDQLMQDKEMMEELVTEAINKLLSDIMNEQTQLEQKLMPKGMF